MTAFPTALSPVDASIVKGMLARGDRQHDVAAWFGVNAGRIADVKTGKKHREIPPAPTHALPPPGPHSYFTARPDMSPAEQLQQVLAALDLKWSQALGEIRQELRAATEARHASRDEARQINEKVDRVERQLLTVRRQLKLVEDPQAPRPTRRKPAAA
jgi:hypothetical protein